MKKIIHIDMDCFYAAVEVRDNPVLRGKPVAVGGSSIRRGVLTTCNYEARAFGARSAMPAAHALRLCPDLILLPVNMAKYKAISAQIREIFFSYTDKVEPLSLDEAYLDVSECTQHNGSATLIAREIRAQIFAQHSLTASAGIAPNKFLAKVASDWRKPDGQYVITPPQIPDFMQQLPVSKIPGVGKVTAQKMQALQIMLCQDLQKLSAEQLIEQFGSFGQKLFAYARGIDNRPVESQRIRKSVSVEETFLEDLANLAVCEKELPGLIAQLEQRLQPHRERHIKNQFVKIKFNDFSQTTAECSSTTTAPTVFQQLCQLAYARRQLPVRLLGVGVHFHDKTIQRQAAQLRLDF